MSIPGRKSMCSGLVVSLAVYVCFAAVSGCAAQVFPGEELDFLEVMTRDVIAASQVKPRSNGGGSWHLTNSCGFTLLTPGRNTYPAFWIRDFSMAADSGFVGAESLSNHLLLICKTQNGAEDRKLANGLHLPPWSIPDHINYDGGPVFYPGTYSSGIDQGNGTFGRKPPIDSHFEMVHIAWLHFRQTKSAVLLRSRVEDLTVFERLDKAFLSPESDPATGLSQTTEEDRAVGFGFCDAEVHTGKLLFASLLRYRAAGEMSELAKALGDRSRAGDYRRLQDKIETNIVPVFRDSSGEGWLLASTGISLQPDVWGSLYALHLGVLKGKYAAAARKTIAGAVRGGTITFEGAVRHVPTNRDFSKTTAWERSVVPVNTYQNGGYWHAPTGWLIRSLWKEDQKLALTIFAEMAAHLRAQDFRKAPGKGAPWEVIGPGGRANQNPVYVVTAALPFSVLGKK